MIVSRALGGHEVGAALQGGTNGVTYRHDLLRDAARVRLNVTSVNSVYSYRESYSACESQEMYLLPGRWAGTRWTRLGEAA